MHPGERGNTEKIYKQGRHQGCCFLSSRPHGPLATRTPQWQAKFYSFLTSNVDVADLPRAALSRDLSRSSLTVTVGSPNGSIRFTLQNLRLSVL